MPDNQHAQNAQSEAPFVFVGDALALDLVNTELLVRGKPRDALACPEDVLAWWRAARRQHPLDLAGAANPPADADDAMSYRALLDLRATLRALFTALADGATPRPQLLAALNALLATCHPVLNVDDDDGALRLIYRGKDNEPSAWLLPIALSAMYLITEGTTDRLHRCANDRCMLLFYDRTRSSTRRWCSAACKDRDRQRRRYSQRTHPSGAAT